MRLTQKRAKQTERRRIALFRKSPHSARWLVGWYIQILLKNLLLQPEFKFQIAQSITYALNRLKKATGFSYIYFSILLFIFRQKFLVARNSLHRTRITDRVKHKPCLQTRNETSDVCGEEQAGLNPLTCVLPFNAERLLKTSRSEPFKHYNSQ
jgi:hypothetical protein